jgi:hypothetical protein
MTNTNHPHKPKPLGFAIDQERLLYLLARQAAYPILHTWVAYVEGLSPRKEYRKRMSDKQTNNLLDRFLI